MAISVFDIDGTLAKKDGGYDNLLSIPPKDSVVKIAKAISKMPGSKMAIVTARPEESRADTEAWLRKHGLKPEFLLLRKEGDVRPDHEVRVDQVKEVIKRLGKTGGNVILYDDKMSNCRAVEKALGINCIHMQN